MPIFATKTEGNIALSAGSAKTILKVTAGANHQVAILAIDLGFHGTDSTKEPIKITLVRVTSAGTMSAATPVAWDGSVSHTFDTTVTKNATAEPTGSTTVSNEVYEIALHGQNTLVRHFPEPIIVQASGSIALVVTPAAGVSPSVNATIICQE